MEYLTLTDLKICNVKLQNFKQLKEMQLEHLLKIIVYLKENLVSEAQIQHFVFNYITQKNLIKTLDYFDNMYKHYDIMYSLMIEEHSYNIFKRSHDDVVDSIEEYINELEDNEETNNNKRIKI
jgi:hypothetical protein